MALKTHAREDSFDTFGLKINRIIDEISARNYYRFSRSTTWEPAVNVYEDETRFHLCIDLAGLKKEQVHVEVMDRRIVIRGNRPVPSPPGSAKPGCILRIEVDSGPFQRAVELPHSADMDSVEAELVDGFLWLTIAKQ